MGIIVLNCVDGDKTLRNLEATQARMEQKLKIMKEGIMELRPSQVHKAMKELNRLEDAFETLQNANGKHKNRQEEPEVEVKRDPKQEKTKQSEEHHKRRHRYRRRRKHH